MVIPRSFTIRQLNLLANFHYRFGTVSCCDEEFELSATASWSLFYNEQKKKFLCYKTSLDFLIPTKFQTTTSNRLNRRIENRKSKNRNNKQQFIKINPDKVSNIKQGEYDGSLSCNQLRQFSDDKYEWNDKCKCRVNLRMLQWKLSIVNCEIFTNASVKRKARKNCKIFNEN